MFQPILKAVPTCFHCFSYFDEFVYLTLKDMVGEAEAGKEHVAMVPSPPRNDVPECQETTTPQSSAPIELISQFSPDGNHEKQEQSTVSVLYPIFHADVDSPNNENIIKCITQF
jgi:hypothetical protein